MFGLSFLNTGLLFLAAATIIPLLIHFFAKKRPQRVIFSTIKFIKKIHQQQNKKINLKNIILLIIRMLIILLTVLAVSRPALKIPHLKKSKEHPRTAVVVILDNSYSMDYLVDTQTELDKGKKLIKDINQILSDEDISVLLTRDNDWNSLNSGLHYGKIPEKLVNSVGISATKLSLSELIRQADQALQQSQLMNREIYVITDLQQDSLPKNCENPVFLIPTSNVTEKTNISCENAKFVDIFVEKKAEKLVSFEIVNHTSRPLQDISCRLVMGNNTVAEKLIDLEPSQRKTESFNFKVENSGWNAGYVEVIDERLTADNKCYFNFFYDLNPKIAVFTNELLPASIETILDLYTGNAQNVQILDENNVNFESLDKYAGVVIYNKNPLTPKLKAMLDQFSSSQKGFLFICDINLDNEWKNYLTKEFSIQFSGLNQERKNITFMNKYHQINSLFKTEQFSKIYLKDFWMTKANQAAGIVLQTGSNPLVLEKDKKLLWLFDPQDPENTFLYDPAFPVFAYRSLQFISDYGLQQNSYPIGSSVESVTEEVILPDGSKIELKQPYLTLQKTGNYEFRKDNQTSSFSSANLDYQESNYQRMNKVTDKKIKILNEKNWKDNILQSRFGYEIWKIVLLLVLVLFAVEMLIVKSEERKTRGK